ncbi:MAG: FIST N-terminal domain-containing protein [Verrucomicrobiota bacterium]
MPIVQNHSFVKYFGSPFSPNELENWATDILKRINGKVTFATCFISSELSKDAPEIIDILRIYGQTNTVIGCTSASLVADNREIENEAGFIASIHSLPETEANAFYFPPDRIGMNIGNNSVAQRNTPQFTDYNAWLLFASSQRIGGENWLKEWDKLTRGAVTVGGFANTGSEDQKCLLFHNGKVYEDGAVAVGFKGRVTIEPVISQGCRPVGVPWLVTKAELNVIHKVGNRPILEVLRDTLEDMSHVDKSLARGNIFIGLVLDEYKSTFGTGDFLVRNLAAIDPQSGAVAIATPPRVGQSMQFQIRDA